MEFLFYLLVLIAYLPGFWYIWRNPHTGSLPVLLFCFIGMFLFNAFGSFLFIDKSYGYFGSFFTPEYKAMVILQPLLFYAITGPYVTRKRGMVTEIKEGYPDRYISIVLAVISAVILYFYYRAVGGFLLFDLVFGDMNQENILQYREKTYGLAAYPFYRLGFFVLPAIIASHILLRGLSSGKFTISGMVLLFACMMPPLLLADKAGIMYMLIVIIIAYSIYIASTGKPVFSILNRKVFLALFSGLSLTIIFYVLYNSTSGKSVNEFAYNLFFRIFGSYAEAMAAVVPYVNEYGQLSGLSLPDLKGLLSHERINLEASLHYYMTHWELETEFSGLAGNVLVPAVAEGFANFKWYGFLLFAFLMHISVIIVQEFFIRIKMGILSYSLMAWYAYLAVTTSMTSIFSTYISFIHTAVTAGICLLWFAFWLVGRVLAIK